MWDKYYLKSNLRGRNTLFLMGRVQAMLTTFLEKILIFKHIFNAITNLQVPT